MTKTDNDETHTQDQASALARSILKLVQAESQSNIPLATVACGSVAMYLLSVSTVDEAEQGRFFDGLRNELEAFNKERAASTPDN
jgi:hypothetical protein